MSRTFYLKKFKRGVIVAPAKVHIKKLTEALRFFSYYDPETFRKFRSMKAILVYPGGGYESDFGLHGKERIWVCGTKSVTGSPVGYLASVLVHETWHLVQYNRGTKNYGARAERGAYLKQRRFLLKVGDKESVRWLDTVFKKKWWVHKTPDGKKTLHFPVSKPLRKFVDDYKTGKLKTKKIP